jgi:transposase-like protein
MSRTRRTFTEEFKQQAVNLSSELGSASKAAQELGINESLIRNWTKKSNSETRKRKQLLQRPVD